MLSSIDETSLSAPVFLLPETNSQNLFTSVEADSGAKNLPVSN